MSTLTTESTIFTLEVRNGITWYIDYSEASGYAIHKDEKFKCVRKSYGEALAYIFEKMGTSNFKAVYNTKNEIA